MSRVSSLHIRLLHRAYPSNRVSLIGFFLRREVSDFSKLCSDLKSRRLPTLFDDCSPLSSHLLSTTLSDFLPKPFHGDSTSNNLTLSRLPFGHHLVYFPPPVSLSSLLPDGTDPLHSPGPPFTCRMWAGGTIKLPSHPITFNKIPVYCRERIGDVTVKGNEGAEKIYVQIKRYLHQTPSAHLGGNVETSECHLPEVDDNDFVEIRSLVFMREGLRKDYADAIKPPAKILKPLNLPDISHTITPTAALLFRFSALTLNAHAIHLDKQYCQEVEGYRNLLVHGPLSLLLMTELLRGHLANDTNGMVKTGSNTSQDDSSAEHLHEVNYRNLAPLYADEEMKVCGRKREQGDWDLWIEGKDGSLAVRGLAKTRKLTDGG